MSSPPTDWKEVVTPGEDERFLRYAEYLRGLQRERGGTDRALHVKGNLGLEAELNVHDGLPEHARQGLGAKPGRYRAYVRVSNGQAGRQHDKKGDIRGFAVKVVGVDGKKIIPGLESARTQDFLCINQVITAVKDADEFIAIVKAVRNPLLLVPRLIGSVGVGRAFAILKKAGSSLGVKLVSVACTAYYSAAPVSWGPYAVKLSFQPRAQVPPGATPGAGADYLGDELTARVQRQALTWDFAIQFYADPVSTPIEDHDRVWQTPWLNIGTLTVSQQDPLSERGKKVSAFIEKASFDPWHALVEHKPLGNMMRARNHAYRLSVQERKATPEPDGSETF